MLVFLIAFYCCLVAAFGVCLMISPLQTFRVLTFKKPLPKALENRWILLLYRIAGAAMFLFIFGVLRQALTPNR